MSQPQSSVIDLTDLPDTPPPPNHPPMTGSNRANRPPRFSRDIIDLEANTDQREGAVVVRDGSPEVEVLSSRTTHDSRLPVRSQSNNRSIASYTATLRPYSSRQQRLHRTEDPPHLIQYMRNMLHSQTSAHAARSGTAAVNASNNASKQFTLFLVSLSFFNSIDLDEDEEMFLHHNPGFQLPRDLDFDIAAFPMGENAPQPPAPTYDPPSPPHEGFTRSPTEGQEIICPNCGDELGLGEDDIKRQVWVIKACGHVCCYRVRTGLC